MAVMAPAPVISRTSPTKLTTPPILRLPAASAASSAAGSKSSRWTRIISASRHRREEGHLVARPHRVIGAHIFLVDGDADHGRVLQRGGIARAASPKPFDESGHIGHRGRKRHLFLGDAGALLEPGEIKELHQLTSLKGRKSTMLPLLRWVTVSGNSTKPSDSIIEERIPALLPSSYDRSRRGRDRAQAPSRARP